MRRSRYVSILALVLATVLAAAGVALAAVPTNSAKLRSAVTVDGIMEHEDAFQAIADANYNNRASGFDASAAYVAGKLNTEALDQMSDATAHAILTFAQTTSAVNGTEKGSGIPSSSFEYKGSHLQK